MAAGNETLPNRRTNPTAATSVDTDGLATALEVPDDIATEAEMLRFLGKLYLLRKVFQMLRRRR